VLDVGAGMGATSLGLLRALADPAVAAPDTVRIERIDALDRDGEALAVLARIAESAVRARLIPEGTTIRTFTGDLLAASSDATSGLPSSRRPYDLVVAGSVLVEVTRDLGDEIARGAAIAERIIDLIDAAPLAPDGAMIVIEPATRSDTRPLHHARAALLERGYGIFAPCTHSDACPMLERDRDWCHEDLDADLPEWLVEIAQQAGLRWEGLTFSYLVVRRDRTRGVRDIVMREAGASLVPVRIVSQPRSTKGKTEAFVSGPFDGPTRGPRLMQLDRDVKRASEHTGGRLSETTRGDLVGIDRNAATRSVEGKPVRISPDELTLVPAKREA
jgi:ribosomal protein RSM22 (predicted rRNA methylase)